MSIINRIRSASAATVSTWASGGATKDRKYAFGTWFLVSAVSAYLCRSGSFRLALKQLGLDIFNCPKTDRKGMSTVLNFGEFGTVSVGSVYNSLRCPACFGMHGFQTKGEANYEATWDAFFEGQRNSNAGSATKLSQIFSTSGASFVLVTLKQNAKPFGSHPVLIEETEYTDGKETFTADEFQRELECSNAATRKQLKKQYKVGTLRHQLFLFSNTCKSIVLARNSDKLPVVTV